MSKEMIERAKDWLGNMKEIANEQTDIDKMEHMKERIEVQDWLIEQAEQVRGLEENAQDLRAALGKRQEQVKRYREALELIKLKTLGIKGNKDTRPFQIYGIASDALEGEE